MRRLIFATAVAGFAALAPSAAFASTLSETVVGAEYAVGTCANGDPSGSFAGIALASPTGPVDGFFNTTICHTELGNTTGATATITGGTFVLTMGTATVSGVYTGGTVGPGLVSPLYAGSQTFCKEVFPVAAQLTTTAGAGSASGQLTHIGVFGPGGTCNAFAAKIAGVATFG